MISKERIDAATALIKETYPEFVGVKPKLGSVGFTFCGGDEATLEMRGFVYYPFGSCCGLKILNNLYPMGLSSWGPLQDAFFLVYMKTAFINAPAYILAASAQPLPDKPSPEEKTLARLGFKPVARGKNGVHGPNIIGLWALSLTEEEPLDIFDEPKPAPKRKKSLLVEKALRRKAK